MGDKILVPLHKGYGNAIEGLGEITDKVEDFMERPKDFKLVLFTGGSDVTPELYGDTSPLNYCSFNPKRDFHEIKIFKNALKYGIKMTGICRGSQFISVMSGGRMMHDVSGHAGGSHDIQTIEGETLTVNSLHHQMIVPGDNAIVTCWSKERRSRRYIGIGDEKENWTGPETEAIVIPHTLCYGVQWHPEMMRKDTRGYSYYYEKIKSFLSLNIEQFVTECCKPKTMETQQ